MKFLMKRILVSSFILGGSFYPTQVWSHDCVDCSVQKKLNLPVKERSIFDITIESVHCTDPVASFDRLVCDAAHFSKTYQELQWWIKKCRQHDPKHRSTILDYYKTIECESDNFKINDFGVNQFPKYSAPLASFSLWENKGLTGMINNFEKLRKSYWIQDKKNHDKNYTQLRAFAKVLRRPDANGLSFLDHVVLSMSDEDVERIGLGADNLRNGLIRKMCGIGVTFAKKENRAKYPCKSTPKFAGF